MISKSEIKLITSLQQKKYRNKHGLFIAEGKKIISDLLSEGVPIQTLYATEDISEIHQDFQIISSSDLKKISALKNSNGILGVFKIQPQTKKVTSGLHVVLDAVRDPGNLGTIIRLCDWFGVSQLTCSLDTVDCYNPKVVQATMGSLARVPIDYTNIEALLKETDFPIYAAVMNGTNVYSEELPRDAILLMGNEANGISQSLLSRVHYKVTIPNFGNNSSAESLNVATATAVLLSEFKRSIGK